MKHTPLVCISACCELMAACWCCRCVQLNQIMDYKLLPCDTCELYGKHETLHFGLPCVIFFSVHFISTVCVCFIKVWVRVWIFFIQRTVRSYGVTLCVSCLSTPDVKDVLGWKHIVIHITSWHAPCHGHVYTKPPVHFSYTLNIRSHTLLEKALHRLTFLQMCPIFSHVITSYPLMHSVVLRTLVFRRQT